MEYTRFDDERIVIEAPEVPLDGLVRAVAREAYRLKVEADPMATQLGSSTRIEDAGIATYMKNWQGVYGANLPADKVVTLLQMDYVSGQCVGLTIEAMQGKVFLMEKPYRMSGGDVDVLLGNVKRELERK